MAALVPAIKIAYHTNLQGIGGPDGKIGATAFPHTEGMRTELFVQACMRALIEVMQILFR
jgi:hypothetical protein